MKTTFASAQNKSALVGFALISFAMLFWIAVVLEQIFHQHFLMENVISKIDTGSPVLSIFFFMGLPFLAFVINTLYVARFSFHNEKEEWVTMLGIKTEPLNLFIIVFSLANMLFLFAYSITENFIITPK